MNDTANESALLSRFQSAYGTRPAVVASAPGRLEVLGNHTDYNAGLTLSCAVGFRCYAALSPIDEGVARLASTAFDDAPLTVDLASPSVPKGHWTNYVLGLIDAMQQRGNDVPGFELLVDSAVPRSAGVSSSAALEMAVLTGLAALLQLQLPPIELARIGQYAESSAVGAQTGLLDQLSSLLGKRNHLLLTDFRSIETQTIALPEGWCFVAIDSGVKHDLTKEYNDRRVSCEAAARAMGVETLREANGDKLETFRDSMPKADYLCGKHVIEANQRVHEAVESLRVGDVNRLGGLMFESHVSSRDYFRNSCTELDELVEFAQADQRCVGARLSGGGFGGITIHLMRQSDANNYQADLCDALPTVNQRDRWSAVCKIDDGATLHAIRNECV